VRAIEKLDRLRSTMAVNVLKRNMLENIPQRPGHKINRLSRRRIRWELYVAHVGDIWGAYRVLVGWSEGERPVGRPRSWW